MAVPFFAGYRLGLEAETLMIPHNPKALRMPNGDRADLQVFVNALAEAYNDTKKPENTNMSADIKRHKNMCEFVDWVLTRDSTIEQDEDQDGDAYCKHCKHEQQHRYHIPSIKCYASVNFPISSAAEEF